MQDDVSNDEIEEHGEEGGGDYSAENGFIEDDSDDEDLVEGGISLDELSRAFAQAISGDEEVEGEEEDYECDKEEGEWEEEESEESEENDSSVSEEELDEVLDAVEQVASVDSSLFSKRGLGEDSFFPDAAIDDSEIDVCPVSAHSIFEAMVFMGSVDNGPLTSQRAAEMMRGVESDEIPAIVDSLNALYHSDGAPYEIVASGGGYRLALTSEFDDVRNKFYGRVREARLSPAAIEVLAIVAYRQPISSDDLQRIRGGPSGHLLSQLVRRMLLRVDRDSKDSRRVRYRTTDRFLELFGLEQIEDLPQLEELD